MMTPSMLKMFRYDKLNRMKSMKTIAHSFNPTGWETVSDHYSTQYSYDWNGNLLSLQRKKQFGQEMHNIRYTYPNDNNRLGSITSTGIASSAYQYDALGNLVRDNAEGLTVGWNAMGKVDTIRRNGNILSTFRYSPTGQRQVKTDSSGTTYYIHDATGNVMCIYRQDGDTLRATERYLYGSKRLGMLEQQIWITANSIGLQDSNTIGVRIYEVTDHLGNVTYTAQDRKHLVQDSYGQWQYIPSAVSYTDYYPFGYPMPGRSTDNGGYRYFFNGQEADNEVLGEGTLHAFEYRMHDTRIGRFWSVDPLAGKFPWNSVYAFAENRVVDGRELEGLEYLDADVCRWIFYSDGAYINIDNLSSLSKTMYTKAAQDMKNWTYNNKTGCRDIGISTRQHSFQFVYNRAELPFLSLDNTYGAVDPAYNPAVHQISVPYTKASNYTKPDKRYKVVEVGGPTKFTRISSGIILAIDIAMEAAYCGIVFYTSKENQIIKKQERYVKMIEEDFEDILKDPTQQFIPPKYMNPESIANIMNVVLFGKNLTNDPKIYEIGMEIFKHTGRLRPLDPERNEEIIWKRK